jgi:hypothetical protein
MTMGLILRRAPMLLIALGALAWPAIYNGQPFFTPDTSAYIRGADAGVQRLTGHSTEWSLDATAPENHPDAADSSSSQPADRVSSVKNKAVLSGRSPYYGALLYLGEITHGFWLSVALQAAAIIAALVLAARATQVGIWPLTPIVAGLLAVASSAPFYASLLMPDMFAGIVVLGTAVLTGIRRPLQTVDYVAWFVLLLLAMTFHDSHILIGMAVLGLGLLANLRVGWGNWRGQSVIAGAIVVALSAQWILNVAIEHVLGAPPMHPPFIEARLIADGPGYKFLKNTCPANGFILCRYLDQLPMPADEFLWNPTTVFSAADAETRRRISAEQPAFTIAVVKYDPVGVASAALHNSAYQLTLAGLDNFLYGEQDGREVTEVRLPPSVLYTFQHTAAYDGKMPVAIWVQIHEVVDLVAVAVIALLVWRGQLGNVGTMALWILVGILVDAAVCGSLSTPHIRYSERVQWVLLLAACLLVARWLQNRNALTHLGRTNG